MDNFDNVSISVNVKMLDIPYSILLAEKDIPLFKAIIEGNQEEMDNLEVAYIVRTDYDSYKFLLSENAYEVLKVRLFDRAVQIMKYNVEMLARFVKIEYTNDFDKITFYTIYDGMTVFSAINDILTEVQLYRSIILGSVGTMDIQIQKYKF